MADTRKEILSDMAAYEHTNNFLFKKARDRLTALDNREKLAKLNIVNKVDVPHKVEKVSSFFKKK